MKKLLLICAALLMMMNANAQFPMMGGGNAAPKVTGRISATILDSLTKQPVEYATVSLINTKTSKPVNGALTEQTLSEVKDEINNNAKSIIHDEQRLINVFEWIIKNKIGK